MQLQPRKERPNDAIRCVQPMCKGIQRGASISVVEQGVIDLLEELVREYETKSTEPTQRPDDDAPLIAALEKAKQEHDQLADQKRNLHDLLERGIYDADTFLERQKELKERMDVAGERLANIEKELASRQIAATATEVFIPEIRKVIDAYWQADVEHKNRLLKSILREIKYDRPDKQIILRLITKF